MGNTSTAQPSNTHYPHDAANNPSLTTETENPTYFTPHTSHQETCPVPLPNHRTVQMPAPHGNHLPPYSVQLPIQHRETVLIPQRVPVLNSLPTPKAGSPTGPTIDRYPHPLVIYTRIMGQCRSQSCTPNTDRHNIIT
jgi:hypothetical protein